MTTNKKFLTKLKKLESEATEGEWTVSIQRMQAGAPVSKLVKPNHSLFGFDSEKEVIEEIHANNLFIAESRTAIPKLIKIIERYETALELCAEMTTWDEKEVIDARNTAQFALTEEIEG